MHSLGIYTSAEIERTGPQFTREGLLEARDKSWLALSEIRRRLHPGIHEIQAIHIAKETLRDMDCERSWHRPVIRFGKNTIQNYQPPPDENQILAEEDILLIDIGPVWRAKDGIEYEGDVGATFVQGENTEYSQCAAASRALFEATAKVWRDGTITGKEIYPWVEVEAKKMGYQIVEDSQGHRIGEFPHKRVFSGSLKSAHFRLASHLWILEIHLRDTHGQYGAFFEDLLR